MLTIMGARKLGGFSTLLIPLLLPFFLATFSKDSLVICTSLNYTKFRQVSSLRLARIQRHLDKINKPPIFTIESPDGDIIDCIRKRRQPALDHPLLKNHKIQRAPPNIPKAAMEMGKTNSSRSVDGFKGVWQTWHQKGQLCPKGTVPVRRSTVHDVLRAKSLYDFGKKRNRMLPPAAQRRRGPDAAVPDVAGDSNHEHAIAYTTSPDEIYGAKAAINVWGPTVQELNEFSLSQIWVLSGSFDGSDLNSIEAGWQSGFVQTNSRIAIGAAISPLSSIDGDQYDITIIIWKDPKLGNWWLGFGDDTLVGYWPAELFTHLADRATMVEWGGEIVNTRPNKEHTSTQMGSGHFAEDGFGKASYFRNLEIVDSDNTLVSAQDVTTLAENTNCYNIRSSESDAWGTHFYYGGPGKNPLCP